jgi:hydroxymethylglutaryl-CoA reductase
MNNKRTSRLSGFYRQSLAERTAIVAEWAALSGEEAAQLHTSMAAAQADKMIENVIGVYSLPLGIGANFLINGRDYLIPMVTEEPSVVAAVSYAARLAREGGGFCTGSTEPIMIGQIQLLDVADPDRAERAIRANEQELLELANTSPTIAKLGGGPRQLVVRRLPDTPAGAMLVVHLLFDVRDAMGANAINSAVETLAPAVERLCGGRVLLRILSNYSDERRAWAEVTIPASAFGEDAAVGSQVVQAIAQANAFAVADPYRAVTHNKGIFNGIDAVAIATGNDWRAIEAGAHAYAARSGQYRALTDWQVVQTEKGEALHGRLEVPLAVGIVGGATRVHPIARVALKILNVASAQELSEVIVAVGLAQNLAAIRALATDGIQRGHMALHARQVAIAAGASGGAIERVAAQLVAEGQIRVERAHALLLTDEMQSEE